MELASFFQNSRAVTATGARWRRSWSKLIPAALALLLLPGPALAQDDLKGLIKKFRPAVVQVNCYDRDNKPLKNGSGFIISPEGHLITLRQVLLGAFRAEVKTWDNQVYPVKLMLADDVDAGLAKASLENPDAARVFFTVATAMPDPGERALVLGVPKKEDFSLSDGMVSGTRDFLRFGKVITISAQVTPETMGGPVINPKGEVMGAAHSGTSDGKGFNFAIPGGKILELKGGAPQTFADWSAGHIQEALEYYLQKGSSALKGNRYADAQLFYRQATRVKPDEVPPYFQLGLAYAKDKKYKEAAEAFAKVVQLKSDYPLAHYNLGYCYLKLNNKEGIQKQMEILKAQDPKLAEELLALLQPKAKASAGETRLPELVKKVQPAVVFIVAYNRENKAFKQGSGFFINSKGYFVTNYHVLVGAPRAQVKTIDGKVYPVAKILAEDKNYDLIVAAIVPEAETAFLPVTGTLPEVGEQILVVSNPKGLEWSATEGIVSAIRGKKGDVVQISAPISQGSSGSPAVNLKGQAFGVNTFIRKEGQLLNFAVSGKLVLDMKRGPGFTLEERAEGWLAEAKDLVKQGRTFMKAKDVNKAINAFDLALELMPDLAEAHYEMGLALLMKNNMEGAAEEYKALKKLDPQLAASLGQKIQGKAKSGAKR